jgi:hypothetical protein
MRNGRIPPVSRETVATASLIACSAYSASPALPLLREGGVHSSRYTRKPWRRQYRSALDEGARSHRYGRLIGAATMSSTDPTSGPP